MAAKKSKTTGRTKTDQTKPADQAEDTTTSEIIEGTADRLDDSVIAEPSDGADTVVPETAEDTADTTQPDQTDVPKENEPDAEAAEEASGDEDVSADLTREDSVVAEEAQVADASEPEPSDAGEELTEIEPESSDAVEDSPEAEPEPSDAVEEPAEVKFEPSEEAPKATEQPPEKIVERVVETKNAFVPAILGGLIAGLIGFGAGSSGILSSETETPTVSVEEVAALRDQVATLEAQVADTPDAPDLSGIEAQIADGLAQQTAAFSEADAALAARLDALSDQVTALAELPLEGNLSEEAVAAYERELAAVQAALAQQRAEVEDLIAEAAQMEAEASESARMAQAQAAATRLFAALDAGGAFGSEITDLESLGVTVPDALVASSDGLVTLGALQADFPALARTGLAAAREAEGAAGGVGGFLQRQLGARSVTPREGDDPDAVLSRAEAALTAGNLTDALSEISTLPEAAQAPLADWVTLAQARLVALGAADDLAQSMASN